MGKENRNKIFPNFHCIFSLTTVFFLILIISTLWSQFWHLGFSVVLLTSYPTIPVLIVDPISVAWSRALPCLAACRNLLSQAKGLRNCFPIPLVPCGLEAPLGVPLALQCLFQDVYPPSLQNFPVLNFMLSYHSPLYPLL